MKNILIVSALIKKDDKIVLIKQLDQKNSKEYWTLPAGKVEENELLHEALKREVSEETGLTIAEPYTLIYSAHTVSELRGLSWLTSAFLIENVTGEVKPNDPDKLVLEAGYFSIERAITMIEKYQPLEVMKAPILSYLRGQDSAGAAWFFRESKDGVCRLIQKTGSSKSE